MPTGKSKAPKSGEKSGTPSFKTFCENFRELTEADLNDPIVQAELLRIEGDKHFPRRIRDLARKFIRTRAKTT
ncbi:hypothetical protein A3C20_02710 [Candidatus Kaiserbacteria bacterium RIFCSPHIGHO2_02_FULL_55_25]|uniref:Uncharacterized protein n=1 Tax=Candidatus Kaiserbacteria bacterium RIFCSPHIGHO2_02_FULL_55_25 TaxID=1798498 RepID=A0A1F6E6L4_9BACT|nr:MAG: hypothetical protein A3C20_02710 [Candidatus Kaiserbacteria bacterium RIFCSPHIGHO2_02_FULL_55_25]OGG77131.1 MAG: hypothetical protein A3F56_04665 [Candidatus Kaiserbacteria bacterium RIFCSPHIGHO2_12_FULL_55_13]OGG83385.1 MAG: hypothetical protein A3A42_04190 [Candidatus Kaiserbacteria bacterium RIFCSPLOWO2_01_FULL_55_25]